MPIEVRDQREAQVLARAVKNGLVPEDKLAEAMLSLRSFLSSKEQLVKSGELPALEGEISDIQVRQKSSSSVKKIARTAKQVASDIGKDVLAVADVGRTIATAGFGEIVGGFNATLKTLFGGTIEQAVADIEATSDFFTMAPSTVRGKMLLEQIAVPLMALESGADTIAETLSFGSPAAATLIKTALVGGTELVIPTKGARNLVVANRTIAKQKKIVQKLADELGIKLDIDDMAVGIVDAARRMTPLERAKNAPALQQAMKEAAKKAGDERTALFETARQTKTFIETRAVRGLEKDVRRQLLDRGFDLEEMPIVRKRLNELQSGEFEIGGQLATKLSNLEKVRRRIVANRSASPSENAALNAVKKGIDEFLDNEFNNIAMESGSAISGDTAGVAAWVSAREANIQWKKNFSEDKVIAQLIEKNATPEQIRQWLTGATTMNASKQASLTIRRLKEVLGDQHPVIEGIRQDFLFELAVPLLQDIPNYSQFVRNFDATILRNPSLIKELGIKQSDLSQLLDFSKVQSRLPPNKRLISGGELTKGLAQLFTGHKLAQASLRVNITRNIANFMFGIDRVSQKKILGELMNAKFGEPAIPSTSLVAAQFITGAALTGVADTNKDTE